jgi:hypothetical protein
MRKNPVTLKTCDLCFVTAPKMRGIEPYRQEVEARFLRIREVRQ